CNSAFCYCARCAVWFRTQGLCYCRSGFFLSCWMGMDGMDWQADGRATWGMASCASSINVGDRSLAMDSGAEMVAMGLAVAYLLGGALSQWHNVMVESPRYGGARFVFACAHVGSGGAP